MADFGLYFFPEKPASAPMPVLTSLTTFGFLKFCLSGYIEGLYAISLLPKSFCFDF